MFRKHLFFFSSLSLISQYLHNLNFSKFFFPHLRIRNPSPGSTGGASRGGNIRRARLGRPPPTPWSHHGDGSRSRNHKWNRLRLFLLIFQILQFFLLTFPFFYSQKLYPRHYYLPCFTCSRLATVGSPRCSPVLMAALMTIEF